jgi:hypothetical protein
MELVDAGPVGGSPGALSLDELGERIVDLPGRLAAATSRWLLLVAELDAREVTCRSGWCRLLSG